MTATHNHACKLAFESDSCLRSDQCWITFRCSDEDCCGKWYCPPCLENVVKMSAELMGDY